MGYKMTGTSAIGHGQIGMDRGQEHGQGAQARAQAKNLGYAKCFYSLVQTTVMSSSFVLLVLVSTLRALSANVCAMSFGDFP